MRRAAGVDLRAKEAYAERLQAQGGVSGAAQASANVVSVLYLQLMRHQASKTNGSSWRSEVSQQSCTRTHWERERPCLAGDVSHAEPAQLTPPVTRRACQACASPARQGTAAADGAVVDLTEATDSPAAAQRDAGPSSSQAAASAPGDEQGVARVPPAPGVLLLQVSRRFSETPFLL